MKHSISVVIPNYNGRYLLEKNLPSIFRALENFAGNFEVIVADDASQDDSISFLELNYPQVFLVKNTVNRGFSSNINSGLKKAKCSLVLALNNDVSLDPHYFKHLLPHFNHSSDTFGVMGSLCHPDTQEVQDGAKLCELSWFGLLRSTRNLISPSSPTLPSLFLSGANALMDRGKLAHLGFYDELFDPFYNEDVELGIRAWRMGWKCYFDSRARAYHFPSSTIKSTSSAQRIRLVSLRNRLILHDIHLDGMKRFFFLLKILCDFVSRWMTLDFTFYQALIDFFSKRKDILKSKNIFLSLGPSWSFYEICQFLAKNQKGKSCKTF